MRPTVVSAALCCAAAVPWTSAANVLAIESLPARSHWNFMRAVLLAMAVGGGHNVTAYTPFASASSSSSADVCGGGGAPAGCGYVELPLPLDTPHLVSLDALTAVADFADPRRFMDVAASASAAACRLVDRMAAAGRFAGRGYALVVVELVSSECASRVAGALDVPLAYAFPSPMASWVQARVLGTRPGASYAARLLARYAAPDTFARRLDNAYGLAALDAWQWYYGDDRRGEHAAAAGRHRRKPAVVFVNSDPTVEKPVPRPGNEIPVGGVHLPPPEPIPSVSLVESETPS